MEATSNLITAIDAETKDNVIDLQPSAWKYAPD